MIANHSPAHDVNPDIQQLPQRLQQGKLLMVNSQRKNGLILYKSYYADFAGPGAIIGGHFDLDVVEILTVGDLLLQDPQGPSQRQKAYLIRRQWIRLLKQITDNPTPEQRAQLILNQFQNWFDTDIMGQLPDEAFALLVGVLPQTIYQAKQEMPRL